MWGLRGARARPLAVPPKASRPRNSQRPPVAAMLSSLFLPRWGQPSRKACWLLEPSEVTHHMWVRQDFWGHHQGPHSQKGEPPEPGEPADYRSQGPSVVLTCMEQAPGRRCWKSARGVCGPSGSSRHQEVRGVSAAPRSTPGPPTPAKDPQAWRLTLTHGRLEDQLPLHGLRGIPSSEEESRLSDVFQPAHLRHLQVDLLLLAKALRDLLVFQVQSFCRATRGRGWPSGALFPGARLPPAAHPESNVPRGR